eukprot:15160815-Ditylum_brightwellii.AAC.1
MSKVQEGHAVNSDDGLNQSLCYLGSISTPPSTRRMPRRVVSRAGLHILISLCNQLDATGVGLSP